MDLRSRLTAKILDAVKKLGLPTENLSVSFSSLPELCDFQTNYALVTAKKVGKNPLALAEEIVNELNDKSFTAVKPGFINIKVDSELLSQYANDVLSDKNLGVEKVEKPRKLLIDYGGANVAKELHVGHLRSPIIGEALKRLHRFLGDTVYADTHLGDWGMQMGLTVLQLKEDGYLDEFFKSSGNYENIPLPQYRYAVKADNKELIEQDLKDNSLIALDYHDMLYRGEDNCLRWIALHDSDKVLGPYIIQTKSKAPEEMLESYTILPPDAQIAGYGEWTFLDEAEIPIDNLSFDVFMGYAAQTKDIDRAPTAIYLYKDL